MRGCRRAGAGGQPSLCRVLAQSRLRTVLVAEAETAPLGLDLGAGERRHLLSHLDVPHLLDVATSEDDVDLREGRREGEEGGRRRRKEDEGRSGGRESQRLPRCAASDPQSTQYP